MSLEEILSTIQERLGLTEPFKKERYASGGCINNAVILKSGGEKFFLKYHSKPPKKFFDAEADGLNLLKENGLQKVPMVLDVGENYLLLEFIPEGKKTSKTFQEAGYQLAELHKKAQPFFGGEKNNYIGTIEQPNEKFSDWVEFYFQKRLWYMAQLAVDKGSLPQIALELLEKIYPKLRDIIPDEPPSLLHGDLWSGNLMADSQENPWFIDPSVYHGHREMDLAMAYLFGGFSEHFFNAYHETYPLQPGIIERTRFYQLYPLLVHVVLFGGAYKWECLEILNNYGV